tara:strand:+ start:47 stop:484 length:438 start_codon:yes stop_codon:yes gene_type:complete
MVREIKFDKDKLIAITSKFINKLKGIHIDTVTGESYFCGGNSESEIESKYNKEILLDFQTRFVKTIKNYTNWSNLRRSDKPVANHIRFLINLIVDDKTLIKKKLYKKNTNSSYIRYYIPLTIPMIDYKGFLNKYEVLHQLMELYN